MTEPLRFEPRTETSEMREFLLVLRQALLMIVRYIERRYGL
jgi:hypothetical protein